MTVEERLKIIDEDIVWKMRIGEKGVCQLHHNGLLEVERIKKEDGPHVVLAYTARMVCSLDNYMYLWTGTIYGPGTLYQAKDMSFYFKGE